MWGNRPGLVAEVCPEHTGPRSLTLLRQKASSGRLTWPRGQHRLWEKLGTVWLGNAEAWKHKIVEGLTWVLGGHVLVGRGRGKSQQEAGGPPSALGQRSQDPGVRAVLPGESRVQGDADFSSGQLVFEGPMEITGLPRWR